MENVSGKNDFEQGRPLRVPFALERFEKKGNRKGLPLQ
jgi:hypothetical protein